MRDLLILLVHLITTLARLMGPVYRTRFPGHTFALRGMA